jgi:hypothetical protein
MSDSAVELAEIVGGWASLVLAVIAILASVFTIMQIRAAQASAREIAARDLFREFIETSIEHQEYTKGDSNTKNVFDDVVYLMLVIIMLHTLEEVLAYCLKEDEATWRATVRYYLKKHRKVLSDRRFKTEIFVTCSTILCDAMNELIKESDECVDFVPMEAGAS